MLRRLRDAIRRRAFGGAGSGGAGPGSDKPSVDEPGLDEPSADDDGSVLLLTIGYAVLALVLVLVCADATSLYLEQKKLDAVADAAALAGADGWSLDANGDNASTGLSDDAVREQAVALVADVGEGAQVVEADTPDGTSARVRVTIQWHPPVVTLFVPDGFTLQSTATSRTALH
ncbi:pilus assembly protein TadG-related protein [Microbacterium luticocti]|uniref:pilus assembly protein TadG-related protein n=1 Tax=Microbacterium luticocti TaxID=451764 RepID=UPI0003FD3734|nr:pilus assembly protein TadG-related protein [Microbacterium luticocti]